MVLKRSFLRIILTAALWSVVGCATTVTDSRSLQKVAEKASRGDEKSMEALKNALAVPEPPKAEGLHRQILEKMAELPQSVPVLAAEAESDKETRARTALASLQKMSKGNDGAQDGVILAALTRNASKRELRQDELAALVEMEKEDPVPLLISSLKRRPADDAQILKGLSEQYPRSVEGGQDAIAEALYRYPDETTSEANSRLALELYLEHRSEGAYERIAAELFTPSENPPGPARTRLLLSTVSGIPQSDTAVLEALKSAYRADKGTSTLAPDYLAAIARIEGKEIEAVREEFQREFDRLDVRKRAMERERLLRERTLRAGKLSVREGLEFLSSGTSLSKADFDRMDQTIKKIAANPESYPQEMRLLRNAATGAWPGLDYYSAQERLSSGLYTRPLFGNLLSLIASSGRTEAWQVYALRRVSGVDEATALRMLRFYRSERRHILGARL